MSFFPALSSVPQLSQSMIFSTKDSLAYCSSPLASVVCKRFPAVGVYAGDFHVSLAYVFEAQHRSPSATMSCSQFPLQYILGDTAILHPAYMLNPSKAALAE